jgi:hypothetical protein
MTAPAESLATTHSGVRGGPATVTPQPQVALVDLLDRVLAGGVVIVGDVTLCIADVELVRVSLRALVVSVRAEMCQPDGVPGDRRMSA